MVMFLDRRWDTTPGWDKVLYLLRQDGVANELISAVRVWGSV